MPLIYAGVFSFIISINFGNKPDLEVRFIIDKVQTCDISIICLGITRAIESFQRNFALLSFNSHSHSRTGGNQLDPTILQ